MRSMTYAGEPARLALIAKFSFPLTDCTTLTLRLRVVIRPTGAPDNRI